MANNQAKYNTYRENIGPMVYESYSYTIDEAGMKMVFRFTIGDKITFMPTSLIERRSFLDFNQDKCTLDTLVFNIGMVELVSYWKCLCPKVVKVKPHRLDATQTTFWKKLYYNGLGEFFYVNGINTSQDDFMLIENNDEAPFAAKFHKDLTESYLVPIGGGKDSVVTLEVLRNLGVVPLIMNPRGATTLCAERGGFDGVDTVLIRRCIDPTLLDLNKKGCLNGHTPFSAMLAFYTLLTAVLSGRRNVALSNEGSANESTVKGSNVNHQYSKSLEFENDFRRYVSNYITGDVNYFSFLRPLSELQIAMLFAQHEKYFDVFKSCNAGSKEDKWCGQCAKCLFAYIILSPFINPSRLNSIFGKSMLDDPELRGYFEQLTGHTESKPFECVGTISEVNTALAMAKTRWYSNGQLPALLKGFDYTGEMVRLDTFDNEHNLSKVEEEQLKNSIADVLS